MTNLQIIGRRDENPIKDAKESPKLMGILEWEPPKDAPSNKPKQSSSSSSSSSSEAQVTGRIITPINIENPENYIILPEGNYGEREYPELYFLQTRVSLDDKVQEALNAKGVVLSPKQIGQNTEIPRNNEQGFLGYITHQEALQIADALGGFVPSVLLMREFLKLLRQGIDSDTKVYNGKREELQPKKLKIIYNDIIKVRRPWRAEWLADRYELENEQMFVKTYVSENGTIKETREPLEEHLSESKKINLNDWLSRATTHGLPLQDCKTGGFYYWPPRNKLVARLSANSYGAGLNCGGNPSDAIASLGVRFVCQKIPGATQ